MNLLSVVLLFWTAVFSTKAATATVSTTTSSTALLDHDVCETNAQCLNNGVCRRQDQGAKPLIVNPTDTPQYNFCTCEAGYSGLRCETHCPLDCLHGGVCHAQGTSTTKGGTDSTAEAYQCKCLGHWTGATCNVGYENCEDGSQCFNGGKCISKNVSKGNADAVAVSCDCAEGFGGPTCLIFGNEMQPAIQIGSIALTPGTIVLLSLAFVLMITAVALAVVSRNEKHDMYIAVAAEERESGYEMQTSDRSTQKDEKDDWKNVV